MQTLHSNFTKPIKIFSLLIILMTAVTSSLHAYPTCYGCLGQSYDKTRGRVNITYRPYNYYCFLSGNRSNRVRLALYDGTRLIGDEWAGNAWDGVDPTYTFYITNPTPGKRYKIIATEYSTSCTGSVGGVYRQTTEYYTAPGKLSALYASQDGNNNKINVSWTTGGIKVNKYELKVKDNYYNLLFERQPNNGDRSYALTDMPRGITYHISLRQYYDGSYVTKYKTVSLPLTSSWKFTNFRLEKNTSTDKVTLRWTDPTSKTELRNSTDNWYYKIKRRERNIGRTYYGSWTTLTSNLGYNDDNGSPQSYLNNVSDCKEYEYRIELWVKKGGMNRSIYSETKSVSFPEPLSNKLPQNPSAVQASNVNNCDLKVNLSWTAQSQKHTCKQYWYKITRYELNGNNQVIANTAKVLVSANNKFSGSGNEKVRVNGNRVTFTDEGRVAALANNKRYVYRIQTHATNTTGASSDQVSSGYTQSNAVTTIGRLNVTAGLNTSIQNGVINLSWTDASNNESGFIVKRMSDNGTQTFNTAANTNSYTDNTAAVCTEYTYEVFAKNACEQKLIGRKQAKVSKNIDDTYQNVALSASTGFYKDKVVLNWSISKNHESVLRQKIYRKKLGTTSMVEIATIEGSTTTSYEDEDVPGHELYRYYIKAEGNCGNTPLETPMLSAVGYRIPWGRISGNVHFKDDSGVRDCAISATNNPMLGLNKSLHFRDSHDHLSVVDPKSRLPFLFGSSEYTIEFWSKGNGGLMSIYGSKFSWFRTIQEFISINANNNQIQVLTNHRHYYFNTQGARLNEWNHYAITNVLGRISIYLNGKKIGSFNHSMNPTFDHGLIFGATSTPQTVFNGHMDEIRIWNRNRSTYEINSTKNHFLAGDEANLKAYYRLDENISNVAYDHSSTNGTFNKHIAILMSGLEDNWSNTIPSASQLGYNASTDGSGNYSIPFVRYANTSGDSYTIQPYIEYHEFLPAERTANVDDEHRNITGQNFTDVSTFEVSGAAFYAVDENKNGSISTDERYCIAEGLYVKVDGQLKVDEDGMPVKTDENGQFSIEVPVGEHHISLEKEGHVFAVGRYPLTGKHNFQEPKSGIEFYDTTRLTVVGRVVGGDVEAAKPNGLGLSKNNIGTAAMLFESGDCHSVTVNTDAQTGEYQLRLFPLPYIIRGNANPANQTMFVASNTAITFANRSLDLTKTYPVQRDTLFTEDGEVERTTAYHKTEVFKYKTPHQLMVLDDAGNEFNSGESQLEFLDKEGNVDLVPTSAFPKPIFKKGNDYSAQITLREVYENRDISNAYQYDTVAVTQGTVTINNNLAVKKQISMTIDNIEGKVDYSFTAGDPNVAGDNLLGFDITSAVESESSDWAIQAYIVGTKPLGTNFSTQAPNIVEHILRDPPGSASYASIEKGTSLSNSKSLSLLNSNDNVLNTSVYAGAEFSVGIGMEVKTEINANVTIGKEESNANGEDQSFEQNVEIVETIYTGSSPDQVGADYDLFMGGSYNMDFGVAQTFGLIPAEYCGADVICIGNPVVGQSGKEYYIGLKKGLFVEPKGYKTYFIYTQKHIKEELIPDLISLRNNLLRTSIQYDSKIPATDERFGTNNDDSVWGAAAKNDNNGPSYTYRPGEHAPHVLVVDSVRWYNQQVRLWEEALALNEKQKVNAKENIQSPQLDTEGISGALLAQEISLEEENTNISFSAGASREKSINMSNNVAFAFNWETNITEAVESEISAQVNGIGVGVNGSLAFNTTQSGEEASAKGESFALNYVLSDEDEGDSYSVDVLDGGNQNGPIFKLRSGETSCPYEDEVKTEYYRPGTLIQTATVIRDMPGMQVSPGAQVGIPADEQAVFTLKLYNQNDEDERTYHLSVDQASNPNGAIIEMDGQKVDEYFTIPAGGEVEKTITVRRGGAVYEYNNLSLVLSAACDDAISTSVNLSVTFVPTCSDVTFASPLNNWVVNKSFNDRLPLTFNDYDLNFENLEKVVFYYKGSTESEDKWVEELTFFNPHTNEDPDVLTLGETSTQYQWNIAHLADGAYDFKVVSVCGNGVTKSSEIVSGIIDTKAPTKLGQTKPG